MSKRWLGPWTLYDTHTYTVCLTECVLEGSTTHLVSIITVHAKINSYFTLKSLSKALSGLTSSGSDGLTYQLYSHLGITSLRVHS